MSAAVEVELRGLPGHVYAGETLARLHVREERDHRLPPARALRLGADAELRDLGFAALGDRAALQLAGVGQFERERLFRIAAPVESGRRDEEARVVHVQAEPGQPPIACRARFAECPADVGRHVGERGPADEQRQGDQRPTRERA